MVERADGTGTQMIKIENRKSKIENSQAFSLIELLVVITIIGVLAAFIIVGLGAVKKWQYLHVAHVELDAIETALENYKAKYGAYPPGNTASPMLNQLYYELSGTIYAKINGTDSYQTLDGASVISTNSVFNAYGVGGFVNCTKGSGEDAISAKNFLPGLKPKQVAYSVTNNSWIQPPSAPLTDILVTSVGGPDNNYQPLNAPDLNPIRYLYPGTNNPNSYDLWVQLVIGGKTNLVCNWSRQVIVNSPLP
jgi:prepilin-type N-terminal cleavage/methylation domain-containing protein